MILNDFKDQLKMLAHLDEPVRRRLYLHVASQQRDVSRDQAARATGIARSLAAFHLDRLVEVGLLEATYRRVSGRQGPGAGRPAKHYRRAPVQLDVTIPQRRYELVARVLARSIGETGRGTVEAVSATAREEGHRVGRGLRTAAGRGGSLRRASRALATCGYEPRRTEDGELVLRNCPFEALRADCREVICSMNLALIEGVLGGLALDEIDARLAPRPGHCCVALRECAANHGAGRPRSGNVEPSPV
jgi:predicted ArsR family transcriptional regulator